HGRCRGSWTSSTGSSGPPERTCRYAARFADGLRTAGYSILNEVLLNQVLVSFGDVDTTRRVVAAIQAEGTCWAGATVWRGHTAMIRPRGPSVFTAHDLLPRRTARRERLWRRLLARFDRVVVHSARGLEALAGLGVSRERLRLIPHPAFASDPPRADDGRTLLCLGTIRPYK